MKVNINFIKLYCGQCDKEASIEWLSMFDRILGRRKPRFCPWCGLEVVIEKESTEAEFLPFLG